MLVIHLEDGSITESPLSNYKSTLNLVKNFLQYDNIQDNTKNKDFINSIAKKGYYINKNIVAYIIKQEEY